VTLGAGAAGLRQKQTLDLIALRTEPFERMGTDAAAMPVEKIKCIGARKLLHVRERVIAEVDRGIVAQHVAKLPIQSKATTDCEHLSLCCHANLFHRNRALALRVCLSLKCSRDEGGYQGHAYPWSVATAANGKRDGHPQNRGSLFRVLLASRFTCDGRLKSDVRPRGRESQGTAGRRGMARGHLRRTYRQSADRCRGAAACRVLGEAARLRGLLAGEPGAAAVSGLTDPYSVCTTASMGGAKGNRDPIPTTALSS